MKETLLKLEDIDVSYGGVTALDGAHLSQVLSIIGYERNEVILNFIDLEMMV